MTLLPHEIAQVRERLDNIEQCAKVLNRIAHRDTITPSERSRIADAERAVEQAIPWVRKLVEPEAPSVATPWDD